MRRQAWTTYWSHLEEWAADNNVGLPVVPPHCDQTYHMFYLVLPSHNDRQALMAHLRQRGIYAVFHYLPLHSSPMGQTFGGKAGDCPVTEDTSERLLRLPLFNGFADAQQMEVIAALLEFTGWQRPFASSRQARA